MNNHIIHQVLLVLLTFIFSFGYGKDDSKSVTIEVQIPPGEYDSLTYYLSKNGFNAYSLWEFKSIKFDSLGNIQLYLETDGLNWFFITFHKENFENRKVMFKSRFFLLVRPGEEYRIEYNPEYPLLFGVKGDFDKGQNLYNSFEHQQYNWNNYPDSIPENMLSDLKDSINQKLNPFRELYNENQIDEELYQSIKSIIEYTFSFAFISHLHQRNGIYLKPEWKKYFPDVVPINIKEGRYHTVLTTIFDKFPINDPVAGKTNRYGPYIDQYLWYLSLRDSSIQNSTRTVSDKIQKVREIEDYLDDELLEYYFAYQFTHWNFTTNPDSVAYLYKVFKDRYPYSPYLNGVAKLVNQHCGYYASFYLIEEQNQVEEILNPLSKVLVFPPEVKIMDAKNSIQSFDSLLADYRGENLLIDFWASWCPPCRYEFQFADSLYDFLQANNFEMVYISTDENEKNWLNVINHYNLKGHHYRVTNQNLRNELDAMLYFIPTYMIIDTKGNIVVNDAEKPHSKLNLYNQLIESTK